MTVKSFVLLFVVFLSVVLSCFSSVADSIHEKVLGNVSKNRSPDSWPLLATVCY